MRTHIWTFLLSAALFLNRPARGDEIPTTLEQEEMVQCRRNLRLIYQAIQAYREVNKALPSELVELQPKFLSQVHLICPTPRRLGLTSADLVGWGPPGPITYTYEFTPSPIPTIISGGASRSMREWKELQMGLVGSEVPTVRCQVHKKAALNLSFGGKVYESPGIDWENNYTDLVDKNDLTFDMRFSTCTNSKKIIIPSRPGQASPHLIDLSRHYNVLLHEVWPGLRGISPLAGLASSAIKFDTVEFDLRGAVQLGALLPGLVSYPSAVTDIHIRQAGKGLHLLVGTVNPGTPRDVAATLILHLENQGQLEAQLRYGIDLAACVNGPDKSSERLKPAWTSELTEGRSARLYRYYWRNPAPLRRIESLDFVAREGNAAPFLVALTVDPNE